MTQPHDRHDRLEMSTATPDAVEQRELRAVSLLLRGLPNPEPPEGLVERVMSRVAERENRPRVIHATFRRISQPVVASALAAGIGCLLLLRAFEGGLFPPSGTIGTSLEPMQAHRVGSANTAQLERRSGPSLAPRMIVDPQAAAFFAGSAHAFSAPAASDGRLEMTSLLDSRLDHQLNSLLLDPTAFYLRLDRLRDAEQFIARLADRAARRGDAAEVALNLRQNAPDHTHTDWLVDRMLRAALARRVAQ